ncbi:MAG: acetylxylan esterase [Pirellulales bacterium]|nr:acetylxylan esterase [Pirellulales bacterium]
MLNRKLPPALLFLLFTYFSPAAIPGEVPDRPIRVLPEGELPHDRRLEPLRDLNGYFLFAPPASKEEWQARSAEVRRQILLSAGLWPMPTRTPLHAVVHGKVDRDTYTVEKVYFESYPGHFVTGSLYRPKKKNSPHPDPLPAGEGGSGKLPAMLCPYGHWGGGRYFDHGLEEVRREIKRGAEKFEVGGRYVTQSPCVKLARLGCVVFRYDMVGVADSRQLEHSPGTRPEMNTKENWGFFSPQAELRLQNQFGLQTYNSICALDFLCSLPDVDTARIGVTGCSGGGTQTFILCAVDPRPAAALPAVMVSTAMQGGCTCENAPSLRIGAGNVDFAALTAPKPLGLLAANDWTVEIEKKGLPELKRLYKLLGVEDRLQAWIYPQFPHNYNYVSRAAMYGWFNRQLNLGQQEPIVEEDYQPLSHEELCVWDKEHPRPPGGPDYERSLLRLLTADSEKQMAALRPTDEKSLAEYRRIVGGAIETMIGRKLPDKSSVTVKQFPAEALGPWQLTRLLVRNVKSGEELPAIRIGSKRGPHLYTAVWIDRQGKQGILDERGQLRPAIKKLLENDYLVVAADLFGQGEFTSDGKPIQKARLNHGKNDEWLCYPGGFTFGYNPSLFVHRVHDVLTLVAASQVVAFRSAKDATFAERKATIDVVGLNGAGHWVAAARAIAGRSIRRAVVDTAGFRFAQVDAFDDPDFFPGGAKYDDLPGLLALSAPLPLWLSGENVIPPVVEAAYRAAGKEKSLTVYQGDAQQKESAAVQWLLK